MRCFARFLVVACCGARGAVSYKDFVPRELFPRKFNAFEGAAKDSLVFSRPEFEQDQRQHLVGSMEVVFNRPVLDVDVAPLIAAVRLVNDKLDMDEHTKGWKSRVRIDVPFKTGDVHRARFLVNDGIAWARLFAVASPSARDTAVAIRSKITLLLENEEEFRHKMASLRSKHIDGVPKKALTIQHIRKLCTMDYLTLDAKVSVTAKKVEEGYVGEVAVILKSGRKEVLLSAPGLTELAALCEVCNLATPNRLKANWKKIFVTAEEESQQQQESEDSRKLEQLVVHFKALCRDVDSAKNWTITIDKEQVDGRCIQKIVAQVHPKADPIVVVSGEGGSYKEARRQLMEKTSAVIIRERFYQIVQETGSMLTDASMQGKRRITEEALQNRYLKFKDVDSSFAFSIPGGQKKNEATLLLEPRLQPTSLFAKHLALLAEAIKMEVFLDCETQSCQGKQNFTVRVAGQRKEANAAVAVTLSQATGEALFDTAFKAVELALRKNGQNADEFAHQITQPTLLAGMSNVLMEMLYRTLGNVKVIRATSRKKENEDAPFVARLIIELGAPFRNVPAELVLGEAESTTATAALYEATANVLRSNFAWCAKHTALTPNDPEYFPSQAQLDGLLCHLLAENQLLNCAVRIVLEKAPVEETWAAKIFLKEFDTETLIGISFGKPTCELARAAGTFSALFALFPTFSPALLETAMRSGMIHPNDFSAPWRLVVPSLKRLHLLHQTTSVSRRRQLHGDGKEITRTLEETAREIVKDALVVNYGESTTYEVKCSEVCSANGMRVKWKAALVVSCDNREPFVLRETFCDVIEAAPLTCLLEEITDGSLPVKLDFKQYVMRLHSRRTPNKVGLEHLLQEKYGNLFSSLSQASFHLAREGLFLSYVSSKGNMLAFGWGRTIPQAEYCAQNRVDANLIGFCDVVDDDAYRSDLPSIFDGVEFSARSSTVQLPFRIQSQEPEWMCLPLAGRCNWFPFHAALREVHSCEEILFELKPCKDQNMFKLRIRGRKSRDLFLIGEGEFNNVFQGFIDIGFPFLNKQQQAGLLARFFRLPIDTLMEVSPFLFLKQVVYQLALLQMSVATFPAIDGYYVSETRLEVGRQEVVLARALHNTKRQSMMIACSEAVRRNFPELCKRHRQLITLSPSSSLQALLPNSAVPYVGNLKDNKCHNEFSIGGSLSKFDKNRGESHVDPFPEKKPTAFVRCPSDTFTEKNLTHTHFEAALAVEVSRCHAGLDDGVKFAPLDGAPVTPTREIVPPNHICVLFNRLLRAFEKNDRILRVKCTTETSGKRIFIFLIAEYSDFEELLKMEVDDPKEDAYVVVEKGSYTLLQKYFPAVIEKIVRMEPEVLEKIQK